MGGVVRVLKNGDGPVDAVLLVDLQQKREGGTNDPVNCLHYPVQLLFFS